MCVLFFQNRGSVANDYYKDHKSIKIIENMNTGDIHFKMPFATEQNIKDIIKNLDTSKSSGIDQISAKLVKLAIEIISKPICIILNHCIKKGNFPNDMQVARITPLYKKRHQVRKRMLPTCKHTSVFF